MSAVVLLGLLGCPGRSSAVDSALTDPLTLAAEASLREATNRLREERDQPPLAGLPLADRQARLHSRAMASGRTQLGHSGFSGRVDAISEVVLVIRAGENVTTNIGYEDPVDQALSDWLQSDEHSANLLDDWTHTGVGVARSDEGAWWFTQTFIATTVD